MALHERVGAFVIVSVPGTRPTGGQKRVGYESGQPEYSGGTESESLAPVEPPADASVEHLKGEIVKDVDLVVAQFQLLALLLRDEVGRLLIRHIHAAGSVAEDVVAEQLVAGTRPSGAQFVAESVAGHDHRPVARTRTRLATQRPTCPSNRIQVKFQVNQS